MSVPNENLLADPKPITLFLAQHRNGYLSVEMAEALREVVHAVQETGKSGSMTVTINIKPAGKSEGVMEVSDDVKLKLPKLARPSTIMYATPNLELQRNDPNQTNLDLKQVASGPVIKTVDIVADTLKSVG